MEAKEELKKKEKMLGLDLNNLPLCFDIERKVKYKSLKGYDNTNYKIYHFVDIQKIEIYLTKATRLEEVEKKYKMAMPLNQYLQPDNEELLENYGEFLNLLNNLDVNKMKQIEIEQEEFQKNIPFEVKYKDNYIWEIYYSEIEDKYFMLFPTREKQTESLFYLIKKQIELEKTNKKEMIYVPINNLDYISGILKKTEITDLENYLWFFTKNWPFIYELQHKDKIRSIEIVGNVSVYDRIKSSYKLKFSNKEEAQKQFKLIKALFILQSNSKEEYPFRTGINENGELDFYFNHTKITYESLPQFIKNEIEKKKEKIQEIEKENIIEKEKWILLKETLQKQNEEYVKKEKQIVTFLECKKTFFGKVSYFFKTKKKKKQEEKEIVQKKEEIVKKEELFEFEEKNFYTIEDLIMVCSFFEKKQTELKNKKIDIKAMENKKENLERKIKNATLYLNEIENHKKSIFEFWKFTNKDEVPLLLQAEEEKTKEKINKIKKVFFYEEDIEEVGKKIDKKQRNLFLEKECDAIFAIHEDLEAFRIDRKEKKLKKDISYFEKSLKEKQKEYEDNLEVRKEKDFDIFGSVVEDKTKIKVLNNQKHREIEKDKFNILEIHPNTTKEEYQDIIHHYQLLLKEAYNKMVSPYDIYTYIASLTPIEEQNWIILDMNIKSVIENFNTKENSFVLNRILIKENMPVIFYSNIMFYENKNKTLPDGMDKETKVLLDLRKYNLKLVGRKDIKKNFSKNKFENEVKTIQVYEYDIDKKEEV